MDDAQYEKAYPNYCRKCQGWGMFKSYSPNVRIWDCEACITKRICPRCGEKALDNMDNCTRCSWSRDDRDRGLPGSNVI